MRKNAYFLLILSLFALAGVAQNCRLDLPQQTFESAKDSKIIFAGEKHREPCNYPIQEQLFDHFYKTQQRQHLLIEYSLSFGFLIQEYIETQDTDLLNSLQFFGYGQDVLFDWIESLGKQYKDQQIYVHGVDIENQPAIMLFCLQRLYNKYGISDSRLTEFTSKDSISLNEADHLARLCYDDFNANRRTYWALFGEDFQIADRIYSGYEKSVKYYELRNDNKIPEAFEYREQTLLFNIERTLNQFDGSAKYFAQFGHIHTTRAEVDTLDKLKNWRSVAFRLNEKQVTTSSIGILHLDTMDDNDLKLFRKEEMPVMDKSQTPVLKKSKGDYFDLVIIY